MISSPSSPGATPRVSVRRGGFALVAVLCVLVLFVVLLVSLGLLLQSEGRSSAAMADVSEARTLALFAVQKAVGELQGLAGPDQRVTATADILASAHSSKRHWTGVWRTDDYDPQDPDKKTFLGWLVSSPERLQALSDAEGALDGETVVLVGEGDVGEGEGAADDRISAPLVPVAGAEGKTIGEYAYWVGDEGVKAKFDLTRPADEDTSRARYDFMTSQRDAVEFFGSALDAVFPETVASDAKTPKLLAREQLGLLGIEKENRQKYFHDFTLFSRGVISDTKNGGLRQDLTWLFESSDGDVGSTLASLDKNPSTPGSQIDAQWPSDPSLLHWPASPTWELLRSFYRFKDEELPLKQRRQTATEHGAHVVITRLVVRIRPGIRGAGTQSFLRANLDVQVVLWNPYNVPLEGQEFDVEIAARWMDMGLWVRKSGQPETQHGRLYDMKGAGGAGFLPFQDQFAENPSGHVLSFRIPAVNFGPGETRIFTIADSEDGRPYSGANLLANQAADLGVPNTVWLEHPTPVDAAPPLPGFRLARNPFPAGTLKTLIHLALKDPGTAGNPAPAGYWSRLGRRSSEGSNTYTDPDYFPLGELVSSEPGQVQQFNAWMFSGDGYRNERWVANHNPRGAVIDLSAGEQFNNPAYGYEWHAGVFDNFPAGLPPSNVEGGLVRERPYEAQRSKLALFEIPQGGIMRLTLADFQHANVNPVGTSNAYLIGNSLVDIRLGTADSDAARTVRPIGSSANSGPNNPVVDGSYLLNDALWDRYFLSTVGNSYSQSDLDAQKPLPNARMRPIGDASLDDLKSFDRAAANLMLDGAFNVNSTSVEAWKALLAGRYGLRFNPVTGGSSKLGIIFSRLSVPVAGNNVEWQGYRQLNASTLQALAQAIVAEVRKRGPFMSLADFVNRRLGSASDPRSVKGALAAALDDANPKINNNSPQMLPNRNNSGSNWSPAGQAPAWYIHQGMVGSRNEGATNWITQGDILQGIGGAIAVRSDTFVVRGYGRALTPLGDVAAEARCEAIVQRMPAPVEPSPANPNEPANPDLLGREFRVVAFRWLNPDDF